MLLKQLLIISLGIIFSGAAVAPPERPYNILLIMPTSPGSHRVFFMPLVRALAERGHKVTVLNALKPFEGEHPNIVQIRHGVTHANPDNIDLFALRHEPMKIFDVFASICRLMAQDFYNDPPVKALYEKRDEFDLIILDHIIGEAGLPFVHERTYITINPAPMDPIQSAHLGNLQNPAYVGNMIEDYTRPFSIGSRVKSLFISLLLPRLWGSSTIDPVEEELQKQFPHLPPFSDIIRNQSLALMNSHFSLEFPYPVVPNQIQVGGMHLRPGSPLPEDIDEFLSGSSPVVYMSLGSMLNSSIMPEAAKQAFFAAFEKLPFKVIWKFEQEPPRPLRNVLMKSWLPQQDVLAHPNVKVFIYHCGWLGSQEAVYHGTGIVCLPLFGDQIKNAVALENLGVAVRLEWSTVTEEAILAAVYEVINNSKSRDRASQVSTIFKDQPMSPVDTAVFWTEYVIRHHGAVHLRSPERDLSWAQLLYLDVEVVVLLLLYGAYRALKKLVALCRGFFVSSQPSKLKQN